MYDMNQQPLNHESTPITTKPGAFSIKLYWCVLRIKNIWPKFGPQFTYQVRKSLNL